ncbi:hypothetical protein FRC01_013771, partial [Tulasnella sp. 417]
CSSNRLSSPFWLHSQASRSSTLGSVWLAPRRWFKSELTPSSPPVRSASTFTVSMAAATFPRT